jgi:hypothetical protein
MIDYDSKLKIRDALNIYFSRYHFTDGGYSLKWFKIKLGMFYIPLPNIPSRIRAVKFHDIHHVITGYEANYQGEAEIGGWEIASGCGKYYVAWILNFGSFLIGMILYPRYLLQAFLRGRRCKSNLYYETIYNENLLDKTVEELKKEIEIDLSENNSTFDYLLFLICCIISITPYLIFGYCIYLLFR